MGSSESLKARTPHSRVLLMQAAKQNPIPGINTSDPSQVAGGFGSFPGTDRSCWALFSCMYMFVVFLLGGVLVHGESTAFFIQASG